MKRIIYLFILVFLFIPTMVFADSAGPSILGYDAVITNKNGVKVTDYDDKSYTIKYNTKVHVYSESDGEASCELVSKKSGDIDSTFTVKLKDIAPVKKEVVPKDLEKVNNQGSTLEKNKREFIIVNPKGAKLSKGPADIYGKYDKTIPYETILHSSYVIEAEGIGESYWYYIDDNGYKGWLDNSTNNYGVYEKGDLLTFNSADLKDKDGNVLTKIPAEEKISEVYYGNGVFYMKYKDYKGLVESNDKFDLGYKSKKGYIFTLNKTNIISMDGDVRGVIPVGEKVKIMYASSDDEGGEYYYHNTACIPVNGKCYYYVEYNGTKGFVGSDDVTSLYYEYETKTVELKEEKDLYEVNMFNFDKQDEHFSDFVKRFNRIEKIPKSGSVTYYDIDEMYDDEKEQDVKIELVKYKGKIGCIITYVEKGEEKEEPTSEPAPMESPTVTPNSEKPTASEKNSNIILYCIIGGVVLAIAAIGTIIAINKKKQEKPLEKKEEKPEKQEVKKEEPKEKNKE